MYKINKCVPNFIMSTALSNHIATMFDIFPSKALNLQSKMHKALYLYNINESQLIHKCELKFELQSRYENLSSYSSENMYTYKYNLSRRKCRNLQHTQ